MTVSTSSIGDTITGCTQGYNSHDNGAHDHKGGNVMVMGENLSPLNG